MEFGETMSLAFGEFELYDLRKDSPTSHEARVVAAKFQCGAEWRLVAGDAMRVRCREHVA
jgi:hypothetical protein